MNRVRSICLIAIIVIFNIRVSSQSTPKDFSCFNYVIACNDSIIGCDKSVNYAEKSKDDDEVIEADGYNKQTQSISGENICPHIPNTYEIDKEECVVGDIPHSFDMLPNGSVSLKVPLEGWSAQNAFIPELALVYNSHSGPSALGLGWDISGISKIARCNENFYFDGKSEGIKLSESEAFMLDGQRLIKIKAEGNSTYYETQSGNIKAIAYGSGENMTFQVLYPDGKKAKYDINDGITYFVTKLTDKTGKEILYDYDLYKGTYRIRRILYSGNAFFTFLYEPLVNKFGKTKKYYGGKLIECDYRLASINSRIKGSLVKYYTFAYASLQNLNSLLLNSINCSVTTESINYLKFFYGKEEYASVGFNKKNINLSQYFEFNDPDYIRTMTGKFEYGSVNDGLIMLPNKIQYYEDISNDVSIIKNLFTGKEDIVVASGLGGVFANQSDVIPTGKGFVDVFCMDVDDIPGEEIIKINNYEEDGFDKVFIHVYTNHPLFGLMLKYTRTLQSDVITNSRGKSIVPKYYFPGDYNGDGKMELLIVSVSKVLNQTGLRSRMKVIDLESDVMLMDYSPFDYNVYFPSSKEDGEEAYKKSEKLHAFDYDGDGKTDLCHINSTGTHIYTFVRYNDELRVNYVKSNSFPSKESLADKVYMLGEFNGDSKTDIIVSPLKSGGNNWTMYLSKGDGLFESNSILLSHRTDKTNYFLQDINSDGQIDLVEYRESSQNNPEYIMSSYILAEGQYQYLAGNLYLPSKTIFVPTTLYNQYMRSSVINITNTGNVGVFSYRLDDSENRLMQGYVDSYGNVTKIAYGKLHPSDDYEAYRDAIFPYKNFSGNYSVCTEMQKYSSGILTNDVLYKYVNGVIHLQGLGFCGFAKVEKNDSITGEFLTQTFNPYKFGIPVTANSNKQDNTYEFHVNESPNKKLSVVMTSKNTVNNENNIQVSATYEYDDYDNMILEKNNYPGSLQTQKKIQYINNVNDSINFVGIPKRIEDVKVRDGLTSSSAIVYEYNNMLPVKKTESKDGHIIKEEQYDYDQYKNIVEYKYRNYNSEWLNMKYTYSEYNPVSVTDELGLTTAYKYGNLGNLDYVTDHKGNKTSFKFDEFNRKIETIHPDQSEEKVLYSWVEGANNGLYKVVTSKTNKPLECVYYNALKQEVRKGTQSFDGSYLYVDKIYDIKGRLIKESLPYKTTPQKWDSYSYDQYDRIVSKNFVNGKTETYSYQGCNVSITNSGITKNYKYDALDNLISVSDPGGFIENNYRADGQLQETVVNNELTTSFTYDIYGRKTSINDPSGGLSSYTYDGAGNVNTETDARGEVIKSTYDKYNRLLKCEYGTSLIADYSYNSDGKLQSIISNNGKKIEMFYDSLLRVQEYRDEVSTIYYFRKILKYAPGGIVKDVDYYQKSTFLGTENYKYSNGYLSEITLNDTIPVYKIKKLNDFGVISNFETGDITHEYYYDNNCNIWQRFVYSSGNDIQLLSYDYSPADGNMNWREDRMHYGTKENFGYDILNRLVSYNNTTVQYSPLGNIMQISNVGSFTYNTLKPYAIETATPFGSQIPVRSQYVKYNSFSRPDSIIEGAYNAHMKYYGDKRKAEMNVRATGYLLQRMYFDDRYEYEVVTKNRKITKTRRLYIGGDYYNAHAVYIQIEGKDWELFYIIRDNLKSITHLVDRKGNTVQELSYDPWGNIRNPVTLEVYPPDEVPELKTGRGFSGHEHLPWFGLINMNARLYDPALGRFLSPDPLVQMPDFTQNFNRYSYCMNNPLIYRDENGEFILAAIWGFWKGIFTGKNPFKTAWNAVKNEAMIYAGLFAADKTKNFWGQAWEIISRLTWQAPQTLLGVEYSVIRNTIGLVDDVKHYRGATFVMKEGGGYKEGLTLGSYINVSSRAIPVDEKGNFDPTKNSMYMHEYGHYLQSQRFGIAYVPVIGVPSLFSALTNTDLAHPNQHLKTHNVRWYEIGANKLAADYFDMFDNWNEHDYPLTNPTK